MHWLTLGQLLCPLDDGSKLAMDRQIEDKNDKVAFNLCLPLFCTLSKKLIFHRLGFGTEPHYKVLGEFLTKQDKAQWLTSSKQDWLSPVSVVAQSWLCNNQISDYFLQYLCSGTAR